MGQKLAHTVTSILGDGSHILLVAGTAPGPGVGVIAANLSAAITRTYADATLVCADLSAAAEPYLFGLRDGPGLAEVLTGTATADEVRQPVVEIPRLEVIGPGMDKERSALYDIRHDVAERLASSLRQRGLRGYGGTGVRESPDGFALAPFVDAPSSWSRRSGAQRQISPPA